MSLKGHYNNALLNEFLLRELRSGRVPPTDELDQELKALEQQKPLLGRKPLISLEDTTFDYYENASAGKLNNVFTSEDRDLRVFYELVGDMFESIQKQSRRWSAHYESTLRVLDDLEDRIDNILLLKRDALGHFKYVSDDFNTVDNIDIADTTASVDTSTGTVTMKTESIANGLARIDISSKTVTSNILQAPGLVSNNSPVGFGINNVLTDEYTHYLEMIRTSNQGVTTLVIVVDLKEDTTLSKAVFYPFGPTTSSAFITTMMYSQNGVDFILVPNQATVSITSNPATWVFDQITCRYVRFLITKNGYDDIDTDGNYVYEIGCSDIQLFDVSYDTEVGYEVVSTPRSVLDSNGDEVIFSKASLRVCEIVPESTAIEYFLSVDSGTTFIPIDPVERVSPSRPQVIDFVEATKTSNESATSLWNLSQTWEELDPTNASAFATGPTDMSVNFYISSTDAVDLMDSTLSVYRNIYKTGVNVRGQPSGWLKNTSTGRYETVFYVSDPLGLSINLGPTEATLDDVNVTGNVLVSQGIHTFSTAQSNWLNITSSATTETQLQIDDTLYPYNHKMLIEGFSYSSTFTGNKIYHGVDWLAERKLTSVSNQQFDVGTESNDIDVYTTKVHSNGKLGFVVKTVQDFSDHENELFRIEYNLRDKTFTSVVFKAVLRTDLSSVSPVLDAYTIVLG